MIYIHVPFCESRCTYCGFFSTVLPKENPCCHEGAVPPNPPRFALRPVSPTASHPFMRPRAATGSAGTPLHGGNYVILSEGKNLCFNAFADAVCEEVEARRDEIAQTLNVNTLYIGGGTPSVLPLDTLSRIVHSLETVIAPSGAGHPSWEEFTVEVNPEDIVEKGEEYVKGLLALGVNRISMGIQSFDDGILKWMNRRHDSATAVEAFGILRLCGVENISVDLIFGLPRLSEALWSETIDKALEFRPEHISAYQLSIEEGSALEKLIARGKFEEASEEQCRRQYDILCQRLGGAGYHHYEVSNFALPGREAIHNSAYWRRVPYVGLGPGAHSLSAGSVRSWNSAKIPLRMSDGTLQTYSREEEHLTPEDIRVERIMLPLRTDIGLPETELRSLAGDQIVDTLLSEGALVQCHPERSEGSLRIPEDHFFTSDDIIRNLI